MNIKFYSQYNKEDQKIEIMGLDHEKNTVVYKLSLDNDEAESLYTAVLNQLQV